MKRNRVRGLIDKSGRAKDAEKKPVMVEKQISKAKEVVEKDKEEPYVPHPPYKPLVSYPQRLAKAKIVG